MAPVSEPQPETGLRSNLALRIMAAVVLAPLAIGVAWLGGWLWQAVATLTALGLYTEWLLITDALRHRVAAITGGLALFALSLVLVTAGLPFAALILLVGLVGVAVLTPQGQRGWGAMGMLYAATALVASVLLRDDPSYGFTAIVFVFAVVWASDILGYFVGRGIGGPKLWPRVSPKKTWSGAIGGLVGSVAVALGFAAAGAGKAVPLLMLGAALAIVGQLGDLLESALKRRFGVKDSSHIIPGHGGLMDRLDGFVAAIAVAALIGVLRAGPHDTARGLLLW